MNSIKITKGDPVSFLLTVKDGANTVNINDGTWDVDLKLTYQTPKGAEPFSLTNEQSNSSILVSITSEQTNQLNALGSGYTLVVRCRKDDNTVILTNTVPVRVVNGLF